MSKFKVGDKVKIVKGFTDQEYPKIGWVNSMNDQIGKEGIVFSISQHSGGIYIGVEDEDYWSWPASSLELIK